jgi:hypothetical protein
MNRLIPTLNSPVVHCCVYDRLSKLYRPIDEPHPLVIVPNKIRRLEKELLRHRCLPFCVSSFEASPEYPLIVTFLLLCRQLNRVKLTTKTGSLASAETFAGFITLIVKPVRSSAQSKLHEEIDKSTHNPRFQEY